MYDFTPEEEKKKEAPHFTLMAGDPAPSHAARIKVEGESGPSIRVGRSCRLSCLRSIPSSSLLHHKSAAARRGGGADRLLQRQRLRAARRAPHHAAPIVRRYCQGQLGVDSNERASERANTERNQSSSPAIIVKLSFFLRRVFSFFFFCPSPISRLAQIYTTLQSLLLPVLSPCFALRVVLFFFTNERNPAPAQKYESINR